MALSTASHRVPPRPDRGGHLPPLGWIVVAGLLVIAVFAYSSWYGDWSAPLGDTAEAAAPAAQG